jgi:hypothetical protein
MTTTDQHSDQIDQVGDWWADCLLALAADLSWRIEFTRHDEAIAIYLGTSRHPVRDLHGIVYDRGSWRVVRVSIACRTVADVEDFADAVELCKRLSR